VLPSHRQDNVELCKFRLYKVRLGLDFVTGLV